MSTESYSYNTDNTLPLLECCVSSSDDAYVSLRGKLLGAS